MGNHNGKTKNAKEREDDDSTGFAAISINRKTDPKKFLLAVDGSEPSFKTLKFGLI